MSFIKTDPFISLKIVRALNSVDFPAPFCPDMPTISEALALRYIPFRIGLAGVY